MLRAFWGLVEVLHLPENSEAPFSCSMARNGHGHCEVVPASFRYPIAIRYCVSGITVMPIPISPSFCVWLHVTNWCSIINGMRHNERNIPANRSRKQYVGIDARVTDEGRIDPLVVHWPDGRRFPIDEIVEHGEFGRPLRGVRTARYSVRFGRRVTYLYLERIERKGAVGSALDRWWVEARA